MVYEWVAVGTPPDWSVQNYKCNSGVAIAKGTLLTLLDAGVVGAHSAAGQVLAGVAAMDKANNDYSTTVSVWTYGRFEVTHSAAIGVGQWFRGAAQGNTISTADTDIGIDSGAAIGGYVVEVASAGEIANVMLRL